MQGELTDEEILQGFIDYDDDITKEYFYDYCSVAYAIYNKRYGLRGKEGMDFYSLAHEYYIYLDKHGWKPLTDRSPTATLKTWMTNGFRYLVLDKLKEIEKENKHTTVIEGANTRNLLFNVVDINYKRDVNSLITELCDSRIIMNEKSAMILRMILIDGYKGKEVAERLHITPSAVSQRYRHLMDNVIKPYFVKYYEASEEHFLEAILPMEERPHMFFSLSSLAPKGKSDIRKGRIKSKLTMEKYIKTHTAPARINKLADGEIFVFGSNLEGMHGGGAAYQAMRQFGAIPGQGVGLQGSSYAIPTMQGGVETIAPYVDEFVEFAKAKPKLRFLVTAIGCGIAGFSPEEIAPLFAKATKVDNILLPEVFWRYLK